MLIDIYFVRANSYYGDNLVIVTAHSSFPAALEHYQRLENKSGSLIYRQQIEVPTTVPEDLDIVYGYDSP